MITFDEGDQRFNYRVAGIILNNNRVLLTNVEGQDFWFLPGGRGELRESSTEILKREIREEINEKISVNRLVWIMENFFEHEGKSYHELGLYFLAELPATSPVLLTEEFYGEDSGFSLTFRWFSLDEIDGINLVPTVLKEGLKNIPDTTEHIIHNG
jgi:8-oxo-dGTP pyrophosphatase MutT (NUDIX family)